MGEGSRKDVDMQGSARMMGGSFGKTMLLVVLFVRLGGTTLRERVRRERLG
jgi:hypothetical protein